MHRNRAKTVGGLMAMCVLVLVSAYGVGSGEKVKIKGLITARHGETFVLKTPEGSLTVVLDDDTKVQQPVGLMRKKQMSAAVLIPGLKVNVEGVGDDQNRVMAKSITFSGDDLNTAQMIQAGLSPTAQQVATNVQDIEASKQEIAANQEAIAKEGQEIAANREAIAKEEQEIHEVNKRFSELGDYDVKGELNVHFASGSTKISAKDKQALMKLAHDAVNLSGYVIQVKGFADSTGNAAVNQKLSMERAQAVIAYLIQDCNVPVRRVVAPGAMGIAQPAASNETATGRAENRRVEVKVLVNRGITGT
jgi:outer membrane protein OmpA-like peptidoglycan-associated protein